MPDRFRGHRLFQALLRLFPAEFRGDFGEQMSADFGDQLSASSGRPRDIRRLWIRSTADLLGRAPREHADVIRRDVVYAVRMLRRSSVFTATAVASLALGIGLNAAVFSVVYAVLWRDLPYPDSDRLVVLGDVSADAPAPSGMTPTTYQHIRQGAQRVEIAAAEWQRLTIVEPGEPERLMCRGVTANFFDVLGAGPILGRRFTDADYAQSRADRAPGQESPAPRVMIISDSVWQRRFSGDASLIGRRVRVTGGHPVEIVGVTGSDMQPVEQLTGAGCWTPQEPDAALGSFGMVATIGRLAPGASIEQLQAELDALNAQLRSAPWRAVAPRTLRAVTLRERIIGDVRTQLLLLVGAVACVLLVTCANLANLFLARAAGRRDERATRVALGATRGRLARQVMTEALAVSIAGGACGLLIAVWAVPLLISAAPPGIPRIDGAGVDWAMCTFTALITALVGAGCGALASIPPRGDAPALMGSNRATPRVSRLRQGLAAAEIAVALMLVVGATLMVRSVRALGAIDLGFEPQGVVSVELPSPRGPFQLALVQQLHAEAIARVAILPGVRAAGIGLGPLNGAMGIGGVTIPGDSRDFGQMRVDAVSPGYFEALGVRLTAGRFFEERDASDGAPRVILLNERAARMLWPDADPIGRTILIGQDDRLRVIGVIGNLREASLVADPGPTMYQVSTQSHNFLASNMLIKVDSEPNALVPAIRSIVRSIDPDAPSPRVAPLQERIDLETAPRRFFLQVIGLFSIIGLVLAVVGVYGIVAEFVAQRTAEIGVRMAFGASTRDVARLIARQGWTLARVGIPLGIAGAFFLRETMSTMVYGVDTLDPLTYVTATCALLTATVMACAVPAARAVRLDPVEALRAK